MKDFQCVTLFEAHVSERLGLHDGPVTLDDDGTGVEPLPPQKGEQRNAVFARDFIVECANGCPGFKAVRRIEAGHQIEQVGGKLRALMPWLQKK